MKRISKTPYISKKSELEKRKPKNSKPIIKRVNELFLDSLKLAMPAGTMIGFVCLFTYTRSENIPFPLQLTELPSLLLLVGGIAVFYGAILIMMFILPALYSTEENVNALGRAYDFNRKSLLLNSLANYTVHMGFPLAALIITVFSLRDNSSSNKILFFSLTFLIIWWAYILSEKSQKTRPHKESPLWFHLFLILITFAPMTFLLAIFISAEMINGYLDFIFAIIILLAINYTITLPLYAEVKRGHANHKAVVGALSLALIMILFNNPIGSLFKSAPLKMMRIGAYESRFYIQKEDVDKVPEKLIEKSDGTHAITHSLYVVMDIGGTIHLREKKDNKIKESVTYELQRKYLHDYIENKES